MLSHEAFKPKKESTTLNQISFEIQCSTFGARLILGERPLYQTQTSEPLQLNEVAFKVCSYA